MSPLEALNKATGAAGQLLAMSGPRAPYALPLGVIQPGAAADLLAVNGDPSASLDFLGDPEANLPLIMKAGAVMKDQLGSEGAR
jgi:imidazolonepropionase-like amidohydrolase